MIGDLTRSQIQCDAKVAQLDRAVFRQIQVGRLQIPVNDSVVMSVLQCRANLPAAFGCFLPRQMPSTCQNILQRASFNELHGIEELSVGFAAIEVCDYVRVSETLEDQDFAFESLTYQRIVRDARVQQFESNTRSAFAVSGMKDRTDGSRADLIAEFEISKLTPRHAAIQMLETADCRRSCVSSDFTTLRTVVDGNSIILGIPPMKTSRNAPVCLSVVIFALLVGSSDSLTAADYWNQFRGSQTNGHAASKALPLKWSESENVTWKTAIDGKAWSSPVVWGNQIWLTNATPDGKELFAVCVDATSGDIVHNVRVFQIEKPMFCIGYNSYGSPTPVVEDGRVWVHFGSAGTACLDTGSGKILWTRQDLPCDHLRGPGSSPITFRNLLIMLFDGADHQYAVALDKGTGDTVWKTNRTINYGTDNGDAKKAYCTPTVIEHEGRLQLICPAAVGTEAYDPLTGKELWKVYHGGYNAAARPLYSHGLVIINLEGGKRLLAVRPDGSGDVTKTHVEWTCGKSTPTRPSQLVVGDHLFMVNDKGVVSCLDMADGVPVWTHRLEGRHSASPIYANGRIYVFGEDGKMAVVAADPKEFRLLAENQLAGGCMSSPGVIDDALLIRTKTHLYRIENSTAAAN